MENTKLCKVYDYNCKDCNKGYTSYQSYWNHNKRYHNNISLKRFDNGLITTENSLINSNTGLLKTENETTNVKNIKSYNCRYCSKIYNNKNSRWSHEQKCKENNVEINKKNTELEIIKEETKKIDAETRQKEVDIKQKEVDIRQKEIELQLKKQEEKILRLKIKLEKSNKIDNVTVKQINKMLMERKNLIKNSTVNSNNTHNNTQNNTQNNNIQNNNVVNNTFQLVGFGKEDIIDLLTMQEKKQIMNAKFCCLEKLVEIIHCGKYDQFKNIIITNMKDNYIYKYDEDKENFVLAMKSNVLNSLLDCRVSDIEVIYNELVENNKLDKNTKDIVEKFINRINYSDEKYTDIDGKEYENYKHYKINEIKILLYNNQDKINNDISLLLTTTSEIIPDVKPSISSSPKIEEIDC
jgi:hypothetical protein